MTAHNEGPVGADDADGAGPEPTAAPRPTPQRRTTVEVPALPLQILHVRARATRDSPTPPYLGATLRGALGHALRQVACRTGAPTCTACPQLAHCGYGVMWEGGGAGDLGELARGSDSPRPYVLAWDRPAQRPDRLRRGDPLRFRVTLLGRTEEWLALFVLAIRDALHAGLGAERAPFALERVVVAGPEDALDRPTARAIPVYAEGMLVPRASLPSQTLWSLAQSHVERLPERVSLRFETPLALTAGDRRMDVPSLPVIVQRLAERVERLRRAWAGAPSDHAETLDWQALVALANEVHVHAVETHVHRFDRRSMRSDAPVPMAGIVGRMQLSHVPGPVARLLSAGTFIHVGKQATFGFGRLGLTTA